MDRSSLQMKVKAKLKATGLPRVLGALALTAVAGPSQAQSNVTIYGILDAGVTHVRNGGGPSRTLLDTGVMQASRLGFRGSEDLGGGLKALFVLEQGILLDTGSLGQGGLAFGRQSWVGLSDARLGTLTLGRQYDFMFDSLVSFTNAAVSAGGYANNPLDNDRLSGQRVNNSIKYQSPSIAGFSAGALVALAEAPGGGVRGAGFSRSFGASYARGPLGVSAAYTYLQGATVDMRSLVNASTAVVLGGNYSRTFGIGGSYKASPSITLHAIANESKFEGATSASKGRFRNYDGGIAYRPGADWSLGFAYGMTRLLGRDYQQANLTADYFFSKRTDAYVQAIRQQARGDAAAASIFLLPGAPGRDQTALRVGLRHRF